MRATLRETVPMVSLPVCTPRGQNVSPPYEVELEDEIMKPLVSGAEAKR